MILDKFPEVKRRILWLGMVVLLGMILGLSILGAGEETSLSASNGHGNVPWLCLTLYTMGVVFLSYYLGGIFNSQLLSEEEYACNSVLRFKSQVTLLPISEFIRKQAKAQRERVKRYGKSITASGKDRMGQVTVQRDLLIEAILEGYVFPWYQQISDERMFLSHSQIILQEAFNRLRVKIGHVSRRIDLRARNPFRRIPTCSNWELNNYL